MMWNQWKDRWLSSIQACEKLGGDTCLLEVNPPASIIEIEKVEQNLNIQLPTSFKKVLCEFSKCISFYWFAPKGLRFSKPFHGIFCGNCSWSLNNLEFLEKNRKDWISVCFQNPTDPYDKVWYNKLNFLEVGNGDILAIDMSVADGPVVYVSHDGGDGHGYILGVNFIDFIDRWSRLGCVGSEDWQMMPFISSPTSFIDPDCSNAKEWRKLFGLNF